MWDISDLVERLRGPLPPPPDSTSLLFSWRAHLRCIVRLEYVKGLEGLVTCSTDCTVRMWTLRGEQIGMFGQEQPWALAERGTWFDSHPARWVREGDEGAREGWWWANWL